MTIHIIDAIRKYLMDLLKVKFVYFWQSRVVAHASTFDGAVVLERIPGPASLESRQQMAVAVCYSGRVEDEESFYIFIYQGGLAEQLRAIETIEKEKTIYSVRRLEVLGEPEVTGFVLRVVIGKE